MVGWSLLLHSARAAPVRRRSPRNFPWPGRVALCGTALDIDPQGSFSAWVELRRVRLGAKAIGFDFAGLRGWRATQWVDDRAGGRIWC